MDTLEDVSWLPSASPTRHTATSDVHVSTRRRGALHKRRVKITREHLESRHDLAPTQSHYLGDYPLLLHIVFPITCAEGHKI